MTTTDEPGVARSPGITYQQLLDDDTHEVPAVLRLNHPQYLGSEDVDASRYTSRDWHDEEVRHVWRKAWQYTCRTDEIPEIGDFYVYEIVRDSYVVIRTESGIKAYVNACLHRGRRLKDHDGHCRRYVARSTGLHGRSMEPSRMCQADGTSHISKRRILSSRGEGRNLGRLRVHQPGPRCGTA